VIYVNIEHKINVETVLGDGRICYYDIEDQQWVVLEKRLADLIYHIELIKGVDRVQVVTSGEIVDHSSDSLGHRTMWFTLTWVQAVDQGVKGFFDD
jgi:hypothetical protein